METEVPLFIWLNAVALLIGAAYVVGRLSASGIGSSPMITPAE